MTLRARAFALSIAAAAAVAASSAAPPARAQEAPPIHAPPFPSAEPPPPAQPPPYPGPQPYPPQPYPPPQPYGQPPPAQPPPYPGPQPYPPQPSPYGQPQPPQPSPYGQPYPPRDPADVYHPSIKMEAGVALRKVDDFGFFGMDLRGAVGKQNEHLGHYGTFAFQWGETGEHLRTYAAKVGYNLDGRIDILRIGFGLEGGWLFMRRASVDTRMISFGVGAFGHASVDLVKLGREGRDALYVDVRVDGALHFQDIAYWGPSVMLGFRF